MTTEQLQHRITRIQQSGYGQWNVYFNYRGRENRHYTTNSIALDRYNSRGEIPDRARGNYHYTLKQAILALIGK